MRGSRAGHHQEGGGAVGVAGGEGGAAVEGAAEEGTSGAEARSSCFIRVIPG